MRVLFLCLLILLGLIGFSLAVYIHVKKQAKKKLVCPMRSNCDTVIHSDYSRILGIPVEILGMMYYGFISISYVLVLCMGIWSVATAYLLLGASISSVLFSIYLVSLQAFVLKQWCAWCICSAFTSLFILIFSYLHLLMY